MFFQTGKYLVCLFAFSVFLVFAPSIVAQNNCVRQSSDGEAQPENFATESEDYSKTIRGGGLPNSRKPHKPPTPFQADDLSEKKDSRKSFDSPEIKREIFYFGELKRLPSNKFKYRFRPPNKDKNPLELDFSLSRQRASLQKNKTASAAAPQDSSPDKEGFQWRSAIAQSLLFLGIQHGYAFTQPKTREALKGRFLKDYADSVKSLRGWDDGGRFFTNYVAHPMQGAFTGFIYVQNDPKGRKLEFGMSGDYWRSRLKALAWATAWSTQFEIGPISQASIGNVGLKGKQTWEDIIVTPTLGTAMLVAEDALDRYVMQRIERRTDNFYVKILSRMLLSPTRVFANMLRFKPPWYRDRPMAR